MFTPAAHLENGDSKHWDIAFSTLDDAVTWACELLKEGKAEGRPLPVRVVIHGPHGQFATTVSRSMVLEPEYVI